MALEIEHLPTKHWVQIPILPKKKKSHHLSLLSTSHLLWTWKGLYRFHESPTQKNLHLLSWAHWLMPVIPATQEIEIGRIMVQDRPRQKVIKTLSQSISWVWWFTPETIEVWGWPWGKMRDPPENITKKQKCAGKMAYEIELLPSKSEVKPQYHQTNKQKRT
jgi:hypothetical protein